MNILVSAYARDPTRGGEFGNGWKYASNLQNDYSIWCLTTSEGKEGIEKNLEKLPPGQRSRLHIVYVDTYAWLLKWKEKSTMIGLYFHYTAWQYIAFRKAKKLTRQIDFDLVHHATYASLQQGSFLWKLKKHMIFGPVGGGQRSPKIFKKYFYTWWALEKVRDWIGYFFLNIWKIGAKNLKKADLVLVNNGDTYDLAKRYGAKNISYAPCVTLADDFGPGVIPVRARKETFRLLWVGRIIPRKGLRVVLEAFAQLDPHLPIELTIIGDGVLGSRVPGWLKELGIEQRVNWLGKRPLTEVREAYASHDAFIFCSLRESLAAQFIEAMSFGLPMIILNLHGAKTFIPADCAIKIDVTTLENTLSAIKDAMQELYSNETLRNELGQHSFMYAKKFTWHEKSKIINRYYRQLAEGNQVGHH